MSANECMQCGHRQEAHSPTGRQPCHQILGGGHFCCCSRYESGAAPTAGAEEPQREACIAKFVGTLNCLHCTPAPPPVQARPPERAKGPRRLAVERIRLLLDAVSECADVGLRERARALHEDLLTLLPGYAPAPPAEEKP